MVKNKQPSTIQLITDKSLITLDGVHTFVKNQELQRYIGTSWMIGIVAVQISLWLPVRLYQASIHCSGNGKDAMSRYCCEWYHVVFWHIDLCFKCAISCCEQFSQKTRTIAWSKYTCRELYSKVNKHRVSQAGTEKKQHGWWKIALT